MTEDPKELFVVRLYDGFDNQWIDVSEAVSYGEAWKIWSRETKGGMEKTGFTDIDYYRIFPADTKMKYSEGFGSRD